MSRFSLIFLLFVIGCDQYQMNQPTGSYTSLASAELNSCFYNLDSSGELISWAPDSRVTFYFEKNVPDEMKPAIQVVANKWTSTSGESLIQFSSETIDSASSQLDNKNIIYWHRDISYFNINEQGRTVIRWKKSKIVDADIMINAGAFDFFTEAPASGPKIHIGSLLVHEFGHALGLRHISQVQSLMFPSLGYLQVRITPSTIDSKTLRCEYQ